MDEEVLIYRVSILKRGIVINTMTTSNYHIYVQEPKYDKARQSKTS